MLSITFTILVAVPILPLSSIVEYSTLYCPTISVKEFIDTSVLLESVTTIVRFKNKSLVSPPASLML